MVITLYTEAMNKSKHTPHTKKTAASIPSAINTEAKLPATSNTPKRPARATYRTTVNRTADTSAVPLKWTDRARIAGVAFYRKHVRNYLLLMRLDRPIGILLLLWPTWWALWLAAGDFPPISTLVIFTLGVVIMRSAGCVINDFADHRWLDPYVARTKNRPLASGQVSKRAALILFAALLGCAFSLVLFTNPLTIELSVIGAVLATAYPFAKRVTHLAQVVLGAAFGWSIPMAFAAVTHEVPPLCWLLFLANVLFSTIYDTEYAMMDRDEDIKVGAKSTAILFADADLPILAILMGMFLFTMLLVGTRAHLNVLYFISLGGAALLLGWQLWNIRDRTKARCFEAFQANNWVGAVLWLGMLLALATSVKEMTPAPLPIH